MVILRAKTVELVRITASHTFNILAKWFDKSKLKLNSAKTHFMYLVSHQRAGANDLSADLIFGTDSVTPSLKEKLLGIQMATTMSMKYHLLEGEDSLVERIGMKMRGLWQLRNVLSFKARKSTALGLVMSRIMFSIEVWGPSATEQQIQQIQTCQNQILRFICRVGREARLNDMLRMTGMISIRQLIAYRVLISGLNFLYTQKPE